MLWFVTYAYPWFPRGGGMYIGVDTGVFAFTRDAGPVGSSGSFRVYLL